MANKYIYVGDIDADIDDLVAIEYMKHVDRLGAVVLDGHSRNESREHTIDRLRIPVLSFIPVGTSVVFCGGALTKVAEYLKSGNSLDLLVVNGGFAGDNLVPRINRLQKFSGKNTVRTFNFNLDIEAADYVLTYGDIKKIVMVSKNVCHSELNTLEHLYIDEISFFKKGIRM